MIYIDHWKVCIHVQLKVYDNRDFNTYLSTQVT